ncbi:MAG: hypothetical protein IIZ92_13295 [Aquincola sp.]|uniref:hypothetical protein n=1 Tax=uncultured Aquincola sp. TaxID=886556 RepID=UPI0032B16329|nr:hypothetical protein [Aquincola sp.]|tara:strand:+ start:922 stop:1887 length:966 start_codon:yes stop_codon:yes gene_type:complete
MATEKNDPGGDQRRTGVWVASGLLLLVFGFTLALTLPAYATVRSNPFWFIGMLVIFGSALALIAVVFKWLGLAVKDEAFGLPAGSLRSLLAVGVMVLFAVFGLQALSGEGPQPKTATQSLTTVVVPGGAAEAQAEIQRYAKANLLAVATPASGVVGTELRLYPVAMETPAASVDMQKQIITALITLLTSVVSFYFGSRTVEAAAKGITGGGGAPAMSRVTEEELKRIDQSLADAATRLATLQAASPAPGAAEALAAALTRLQARLKALKAERGRLDALAKDAAAGSATFEELDRAVKALRKSVDEGLQELVVAEALVSKPS